MRHKNSTHVQKTTKTVHMYKKTQKQYTCTKNQPNKQAKQKYKTKHSEYYRQIEI
jgi:hypothetical protein